MLPPSSDLAAPVWIVPVVATIVAVGASTLAFVRWSRRRPPPEAPPTMIGRWWPPPSSTSTMNPDERTELEQERTFLLRSLADLEREHDAGDIDDADLAML